MAMEMLEMEMDKKKIKLEKMINLNSTMGELEDYVKSLMYERKGK
jgi:hypothetical protein